MIYYVSLPFFLLLFIVLQNRISQLFFSGIVGIEASLVLVIYAGFRLDVIRGGLISFLLGFFLDCISGSISGFYSCIYVSIFLISMTASMRFSLDNPILIMIFTLICLISKGILVTVLYLSVYRINISFHQFMLYIPQALTIILLSPLFFHLFYRIEGLLNDEHA